MYFRSKVVIANLQFDLSKGESLYFEYGNASKITIDLHRPTPEEQMAGYKDIHAICIADTEAEPTEKIRAMFVCLIEKKLPPGSKPQSEWSNYLLDPSEGLESDGTIKNNLIPPLGLMPQSFQEFAMRVNDELRDYVRRTVGVLRWRSGQWGPHDPILSSRFTEWSFDRTSWKVLPVSSSVHIMPMCLIRPSDQIRLDVLDYVKSGDTEPVGHELLNEALEQALRNPRSALTLGIAAAEVGLKQYIIAVNPQSQWLIENMPSPPLVKVLEEYLVTTPAKCQVNGKVLSSKSIVGILKKGVLLRNKLVHVGAAKLSSESLDEILLAVRDLLWLLDYYRGFEWAWNYISDDVKAELTTNSTSEATP